MNALAEVLQAATTSEALFMASLRALRAEDDAERVEATQEARRLARDLPREEVERLVRRAGRFTDSVRMFR
jgi:hypothetical protein